MIDTDKYEGHTEGPWYMRNHYNSEAPAVAAGKYDHLLAICGQGPKLTPEGRQWHSHLGISKPPEEAKANAQLMADAPLLLAEVKRLSEIEQEWLVMWATLEELNLVADVRKNMTLHGFVFPTDEDMEGDEE